MMKAVSYTKHGPPEVLEYSESFPKPQCKKDSEVLVKIMASAVNPVDWKLRKIKVPGQPSNFIPGCDFSGVVEAASPGSSFKVGDKVYGMLPIVEAPGSSAEYVVARDAHISLTPTNLNFLESAAVPLVGLTVVQAFDKVGIDESHADSVKGKKILIHAGAGGVGSFAIQVAKLFGLEIYTTCSSKNVEFCKGLGATHCIDYNNVQFEDIAKDMDFIIDTMGGDYELRSMKCIKSNGYYVNIMNSGWATKWSTGKTDGVSGADSTFGSIIGYMYALYRIIVQPVLGPYYKFHVVQPDGKTLNRIKKWIEEGHIKVPIDKVFNGLKEVVNAHRYMEEGHAKGKVVINIASKL